MQLADEDEMGGDLDPRVRDYFERMQREGDLATAPETLRAKSGDRVAESNDAISRAQLGGIAEGLSKLGTLGGKSPDVKPLTTTLGGIDAAAKARQAGDMADEDDRQKQFGMNAKVYEYLQGRSDKQSESELARTAKSTDAAAALKAKAEEGELNRTAADQRAREHNQTMGALAALRNDGKSGGSGKLVGSDTATHIGNFDAALVELAELEHSYDTRAAARGSSVKALVAGSNPNLHEKQVDISAQAIGQILEGGKLTDSDYGRYKNMMPRATDTNEAAKAKVASLRRAILEKKRGAIGGAGQAGYNVSGFNEVPESPKIPAAAPKAPAPGTALAAPAGGAGQFKDGDTRIHLGIPVVRKGGKWVEVAEDDENQPAVEPRYAP